MTNSTLANYGQVIMDVAVQLRGRTPIASALLRNGLGKTIHLLELQDGECILINRDLKHPKSGMKNGVPGNSSLVSWESRQDSLKSISEKFINNGFLVVLNKRTGNLPLLQMPMVLTDRVAA